MSNAVSDEIHQAIRELFAQRGDSQYGGEAVSQLEHGLQAAWLAEQSGATPHQIVAALLHDVGHLLHDLPADAPDHGIDDVHEQVGYEWLGARFGPEVSEPVRLHVAAKRYLCAVDPEYRATLSAPSLHSLALQGGPFTPAEAAEFERHPHFRASVELRRWDDEAKVPKRATPDVDHFLGYLAAAPGAALAPGAAR
ncbi:MAG: metal-dependent phosphohydrolase [Pirellulales bacterium]|nr:metal-dependent phosphohydrolase [Pirellulales bacterium]